MKRKPAISLSAALLTALGIGALHVGGASQDPATEETVVTELEKGGLRCQFGRDLSDSWWTNYGEILLVKEREALADHVVWCEAPLRKSGPEPPKPSQAMLTHLSLLKHLRVLRLRHTADEDLKYLAGLSELRELVLNNAQITDAGLSQLSRLKELRWLNLAGATKLTDAGLIHLSGLTNLQRLYLFTVPVTGRGLVHLKGMVNLRELGLGGTRVTDAGLEHLTQLTTLTHIDINNTPTTGAGLTYLKGLTNLDWLSLSYSISDAGLEHITGLDKLRLLHTGGPEITDAGLLRIAGMTNLENLALLNTKMTGAGLKSLAALKHLKRLDLARNAVTTEAVESLHEALPGCEIAIGAGRGAIRFRAASAPR